MPFVVVVIGVILAIAAWNNSFSSLASELESDIPAYFLWGVAIAAILGLGFIPGFRTPSRWLLALVALVLVLTRFAAIKQGFLQFAQSGGASSGAGSPTPTQSYTQANAPAAATAQASSGTASSGTASTGSASTAAAPAALTAAQQLAANPLNPNAYVGLAAGFGGLA